MDLLKKYLIPFYDAEMGGAPGADPVVDPAVVVVEPAAAAAGDVVDPPVVVDPLASDPPVADPAQHGNKGKQPWFLNRISEESQAKLAEKARADAAERRAQEAEALAQRLQSGGTQEPPVRTAVPAPGTAEFNAAVQQVANQQRMADARNEIVRNGYAAFGSIAFDQSANILNAAGCINDDFLADVLAVDRTNAHKTLATLAAEPERAASLAQMDSRTRIAELTRMSMTTAVPAANPVAPAAGKPVPAPKQVSRAPAPAPAVDPSASKVVDWRSDDVTDEEFSRGFDENQKKRASRR